MTAEIYSLISDFIWADMLNKMSPLERKKFLFLMRQIAHPTLHPWIDSRLAMLDPIALDPDWIAAVVSDPKFPELREKLEQQTQQLIAKLQPL
jgi:hypothetical protein